MASAALGFTFNRHADVVKVMVVGLVPCFKVPLRNVAQAVFIWNLQSHREYDVSHTYSALSNKSVYQRSWFITDAAKSLVRHKNAGIWLKERLPM